MEQKFENNAVLFQRKRKERLDLAESYRDKLQERDAELVDLDADAEEWIINLAKAK